jgi:hypothetical protein
LYIIYKLLVNTTWANLEKVKLELFKVKALLKEDSLKKKPSSTNFTLKALAAQARGANNGRNNNKNNNNSRNGNRP